MESNPTGAAVPDTAFAPTPVTGPLYRPSAVTLATLIGSPIAGLIVMSINYRRLGRPRAAWLALAAIPAFCCLVAALALITPDDLPRLASFAPGIVFLLAMMVAADTLQGRAIKQHRRRGGRTGSLLKAAGIGVVTTLTLLAVGLALLLAAGDDDDDDMEHKTQYRPPVDARPDPSARR
jgi:uncharacterized membrane protein AbrB (regulator of aidB expression)